MDSFSNTSAAAGQHVNHTSPFEISEIVRHLYNTYLYLMIVLGVSGNFVVLVLFSKLPPNTTTDWFILFITMCDFISSFVNVPIYVSFTNGIWRYFGNNLICGFHMFVSQSLVLSSAFLICGLALDRYFKVCKPMEPFSKTKARNACFVISLLTTIISTPCFVIFENRGERCQVVRMGYGVFTYYIFVFLTFVLATAVVVFSYIQVTRTVRASKKATDTPGGLNTIYRRIKSVKFRKFNKVMPVSTSKTDRDLNIMGRGSGENNLQNKTKNSGKKGTLDDFVQDAPVSYISLPTSKMNFSPSASKKDLPLSTSCKAKRFSSVSSKVTRQGHFLNNKNQSTSSENTNPSTVKMRSGTESLAGKQDQMATTYVAERKSIAVTRGKLFTEDQTGTQDQTITHCPDISQVSVITQDVSVTQGPAVTQGLVITKNKEGMQFPVGKEGQEETHGPVAAPGRMLIRGPSDAQGPVEPKGRMLIRGQSDALGPIAPQGRMLIRGPSYAQGPVASQGRTLIRGASDVQGSTVSATQLAIQRTTKIAFLVCTIFIVTWIPPWASFILSPIPGIQTKAVLSFMLFGRMTYLINTVTNPILYTWFNRKFRRNMMILFCRKPRNIIRQRMRTI